MKTHLVVSTAVVALLPAVGSARHGAPPPPETQLVSVGGEVLSLWPYATENFATESDPVNLLFLHNDPRGIRQELMKLSGDRTASPFPNGPVFPPAPPFNCRWTDAMGYEQAVYAEPDGWVGGEVQLSCVNFAQPFGDPFRFHLRLFRSGPHTIGAAHFEFLITGSAEHEVLSWDFAREFVTLDMMRTGTLTAPPGSVALIPPPSFRAVRRPVYAGLVAGGALPILSLIGLYPPPPGLPPTDDVPIPTNGAARWVSPIIDFRPVKSDVTTSFRASYSIDAPKPFCGPALVHLEGPLDFRLRVQTNPSGQYLRTYGLGGTLRVTPLVPSGPAADAVIWELHRGMLTDDYGGLRQLTSQFLLSQPAQFKTTSFTAGQTDFYSQEVGCGVPKTSRDR